ncbi:hypothetical protein V5O48_007343 [Marasmius crinis-equi]|uniref:Uncharacterized protein n=1 Tax=Marasmius crinis-equi TaxID=585013 RepID=A0ABR3FHE2_9AGAR
MPSPRDPSSPGPSPTTSGTSDKQPSSGFSGTTVSRTSSASASPVTPTSSGQCPPVLQSQTPRLSRSERRLYDPTNTTTTQYNYRGGQTGVITGGVMLGGVKPPPRKDGSSKKSDNAGAGRSDGKGAKTHKRGSDSGDWRKPPDAH